MAAGDAPRNLYRRKKIWWGRLKLAGREHRRSLRTADPKEAKLRLKRWREKLEREKVGSQDCPRLKAASVRWGTEILPRSVKPAVMRRYLSSIRQIIEGLGDISVGAISASIITDYCSQRSAGATNATIRRDLTALSRLLACCVAWGWIASNPARFYDRSLLRERREPRRPPAPADIEAVVAAAPAPMRAIIRLLDQTGMRANEAVTLAADDVEWKERQINLLRTKTSRPRTIRWRTPGGDAGLVLEGLKNRSGALFPSGTGDPYRNFPTHAAKVIASVAADAKKNGRPFRRFRIHDLRHGFAIRALRAGMDIYKLKGHLGHSSVKVTEGYLAYLTTGEADVERRHKKGHTAPLMEEQKENNS